MWYILVIIHRAYGSNSFMFRKIGRNSEQIYLKILNLRFSGEVKSTNMVIYFGREREKSGVAGFCGIGQDGWNHYPSKKNSWNPVRTQITALC